MRAAASASLAVTSWTPADSNSGKRRRNSALVTTLVVVALNQAVRVGVRLVDYGLVGRSRRYRVLRLHRLERGHLGHARGLALGVVLLSRRDKRLAGLVARDRRRCVHHHQLVLGVPGGRLWTWLAQVFE